MTTLLDRHNDRRNGRRTDRRNDRQGEPVRAVKPGMGSGMPATAGVLAAVQASAASLSIIMVPVVLAWATASFSSAPWGKALQFGVGTWLLAHHAGIVIPGGHLGLVPLGLMALPVTCCWLAGVRLARTLDPNAADLGAGVGRATPLMPPARALVCLVATYSGLATMLSVLVTTIAVRPLAAQALVGAAIISGAASVCGAAAWVEGGAIPGIRLVLRQCRVPQQLLRLRRPILGALAVQLAGGVLILVIAVVAGWDQVMRLQHAVSPGVTGGLVLVLAQVAVAPNLMIWCVSVAAGPGFAIGTGTAVSAGHTTLGLLPAVPVLGALPAPGPHPVWAWGVLALPALSGVVLGLLLMRTRPGAGSLDLLADTGRAALLMGALWALLGWLSAGPAGPGTLARVGPVTWLLGLSMLGETGVAAVLAVGVLLTIRHFSVRAGGTDANPDPDPDGVSPSRAAPMG